jgi:2-polyprenyl-3-methyl-5-hydroxy-6-metoxy-1,4-benzoquinol methylase
MKKSTNCYLCRSQGRYLFSVQKRELYRCGKCDLVWIKDFKQPNYLDYYNDTTYIDCQSLFDNIFSRIAFIAEKFLPAKGSVFEIGASVGGLMSVFKKQGWEVSGIEPSKGAWKNAIKRGTNIKLGSFEKYLPKEKYNLVIINHTLEHVDDPVNVLSKVESMLTPGGMVLIGVPNFDSFKARFLKEKWTHILPLEHKWQYSPKSLKFLVEKTGFKIEKIYTSSGLFEHQSPLKEVFNSLKEGRKRFFTEIWNLPIDALETLFGHGEGLLLVAKKN